MPDEEEVIPTLLNVQEVAELIAATIPPIIDEEVIIDRVWSLPFNNIIPQTNNSYFIYLENIGINDIELLGLSISGSVAGVTGAYIKIDSISGIPVFTREDTMLSTNKNLEFPHIKPAIFAKVCADAAELKNEGQLDRLDLEKPFKTHKLKPWGSIIIPPEKAIAIKWGTELGALSGILTIKEIR